MNILQHIRKKAQQAITGVGNFIDRDPSLDGVQLAKGGLFNNIANTSVGGHRLADQVKAYPKAFAQNLPFTPERQETFNRNVEDVLGKTSVPTTIAQGFNNWVFAPLAQVPYHIGQAVAPNKSGLERAGSALQAGLGLLPGVDDLAIAGLNAAKNAAAKRNVRGFQSGLAGNEYAGLGDAVTGGKEGVLTDILNVAELPLTVVGGVKAGGLKKTKQALQNINERQLAKSAAHVADNLGDALQPINGKRIFENSTTPLRRRPKDTLYVTPEGTVFKVNTQPKTTLGLDNVLEQVQSAIKNKESMKTPSDQIPYALPAPQHMSLPSPKRIDAVVQEIVQQAKKPLTLDQILKGKSKAAKEAMEEIKHDVKNNTFNTGNIITRIIRDVWFDTPDDLKITFGKMYDTYISPVINTHTQRIADAVDWKNTYRHALKTIDVVPGSTEDVLLRQFAHKDGVQRVVEAVGEQRAAQLKQTYDTLRAMYDEILDTINTKRRAAGLNEIPKKENFLSQIGSQSKGIFDAMLEGGVDTRDPISKAIFKKQSGKNANLGAIESMTQYLEYAARAGFTDVTGAELGTVRKVLKKAGAPEEALSKLTRLEEIILGTKGKGNVESAIESATSQMRQAAVVGKVGALVNQFLSAPQGFIAAGLQHAIPGQFSQEARQAAKSSRFLKATSDKIPRKLRVGNAYTKAIGFSGDMLQAAQQATNRAVWQGFYTQARAMGQTAEEAILFADQVTPKIVGDRRLGMSPAVYNTFLGKVFGAFTLEPTAASNRLFSQAMKAMKDKKAAGEVIGTVIGWHFLNSLYERWGAGYRPYPDIPEAVMESVEYAAGSDEKEQSSLKAIARLFSEALQMVPFANNVFNTAYSVGETAQILPDSRKVFGQDDMTWMNVGSLYNPLGNVNRRVTGVPVVDAPLNIASNVVPFFDQAAKTAQAGVTLANGAATSRSGGITFAAPDNPVDAFRSLVFGQYATPEAQEFYDNDFTRPLSEKETATFWSLPKEARKNFLETKQASQQHTNRLKSGSSSRSIMDIFGGGKKQTNYSGMVPTTKEEKKALADYVKTALEGGAIPDSRDIKNGLFHGYTATSPSIAERKAVYKALNTILEDEYLTDEQKQAVIKASGASAEDARYYQLASKDDDTKLQDMLPTLDTLDNTALIDLLFQGRRSVGGKQLVSNKMLDYLYEMDYISENEKKALKAVQYDEINNRLYISKSYKKARSSRGSRSIPYKHALKLFEVDLPKFSEMKSVRSLLEHYGGIPSWMQQIRSQGETLLSDTLFKAPRKKTPKHTSKLWF